MNRIPLKQIYPPGGEAEKDIEINNVELTSQPHVYAGSARLPLSNRETRVVIYELHLETGVTEYRTVPAQCPHQGADISRDELKPDGNVYCSLHRRPICIYSEYNQAFAVEKRTGRFFIVKSN